LRGRQPFPIVDVMRRFHKLELTQKHPTNPKIANEESSKNCGIKEEKSQIFLSSLVINILIREKTHVFRNVFLPKENVFSPILKRDEEQN